MAKEKSLIPVSSFLSHDIIERKIYILRGQKVMFDRDLAALYEVGTRDLNKAVSRNFDRFPADFMFQLSDREFKNLMFQFGTSSWGGTRQPATGPGPEGTGKTGAQLAESGESQKFFDTQAGMANQGPESSWIQHFMVGNGQVNSTAFFGQNDVWTGATNSPSGFLEGPDGLSSRNIGGQFG